MKKYNYSSILIFLIIFILLTVNVFTQEKEELIKKAINNFFEQKAEAFKATEYSSLDELEVVKVVNFGSVFFLFYRDTTTKSEQHVNLAAFKSYRHGYPYELKAEFNGNVAGWTEGNHATTKQKIEKIEDDGRLVWVTIEETCIEFGGFTGHRSTRKSTFRRCFMFLDENELNNKASFEEVHLLDNAGYFENFSINIKNYKFLDKIGEENQGVFLLYNLIIRNTSNNFQKLSSNFKFRLFDLEGKVFSFMDDLNKSLSKIKKRDIFLEGIQPGVEKEVSIVFEIDRREKFFLLVIIASDRTNYFSIVK